MGGAGPAFYFWPEFTLAQPFSSGLLDECRILTRAEEWTSVAMQ
jgi:hypothetical protein